MWRKDMSNELKTIQEYLRERWRSTEPGLRWAYVLSIVSNILLIRFLTHNYCAIENLLIPVTLCAWLHRGLRIRLVWMGFVLYAIVVFFKHAYLNFILLGVVFNTIYVYIFIGIALSLIPIALVRGFLSFDLRKAAESFFEKASMRAFSFLFVLIILSHIGDLYFHRYLAQTEYIYRSMVTLSLVHPVVMILVYLLLLILIETRYFLGAVFSPVLLIADTIFWVYGFVFRIKHTFNSAFIEEFGRLDLSLGLKILVAGKVSIGIILPILSSLILLHFLIKIPDTVFQKKSIIERNNIKKKAKGVKSTFDSY
jgi:hypothetical protein